LERANQQIRAEIRDAGLTLWQIGKEVWGINEVSTVRRFRYELTEQEKTEVRKVIKKMKSGK